MILSDKNDAARAFGARLREVMIAAGRVSPGSRSGVDVTGLAAAASTSYEMARRYAEGVAIPRPDKLAAIAGWLGVSPASLQYGEDAPKGSIDEGLLQQCLEAIVEAQQRTNRRLSSRKAAQLVALLYQEARAGQIPARDSVDLMVRAAT